MQFVEPKVFAIAQTQINPAGFAAMLEALGVADWQSDGESDTEILLEAAGKMCYMSFDTSLNKNLTKANTRSNFDYLQDGIIKTRHGSVLEHGTVTFCFVDVSRVLCYHPDTEILTKNGWKRVSAISDNEVLLTKDPVTGKDRWSPNTKLHSFDFDGWLLGAKSSQWEAPLVTPDHLLWAKKHDVRTPSKYEKVPASWVQGLRYYQDHAINKDSVSVEESIVIGGFCYPLVPLYRWLGWLASDGYVSKDRNYCSIVQSKKLESNELDQLFHLLFGERFKKYGDGHCEWRITDPDLHSWVLGKFRERTKSGRTFLGMLEDHPLLIESFLGGMLSGDGSMAGGQVPVIYCRDEETAKHLQVLVALTGRSSNVRVDLSRIGQSRELGDAVITNNLPAVCLNIHQSGESLCKKSHQFGVQYAGKVYCPQTEDGLVYVRNKGRPVWSGNTHELVRHRAGAAYSQTSGRYVRSDVLSFFLPTVFKENIELAEIFDKAIASQEEFIKQMEEASRINGMTAKEDFPLKKKLTSAFRRIVGNGVANNIICTYNHRALRNIIVQRTSVHAEEEIRIVFNKVFDLVADMFPALYADAHREMVDGYWEITFASDKV